VESKYQNYISCDVETGNLLSKTKRAVFDVALTEIALVAINKDLEIVDQASWLIKPYSETAEYAKGAEIASGISKQMCEDQGRDIKEVCKEVIQFLKKYKSGSSLPVIFGHNFLAFDSYFVSNFFEYCGEDLMKCVNSEPEDTIKWARMCWQESVNYKLGTCCENAGITLKDAHRALTDTIATAKLFIHFMKNMRGVGVASSVADVKKFRHTFEI
jgi:DNA polymerase III alpha subunit (gram-positive type)